MLMLCVMDDDDVLMVVVRTDRCWQMTPRNFQSALLLLCAARAVAELPVD